ncbi:cytochrome P450 [Mycena maculata]|uniref:Cytochrome P450 n=1 Tax=Mycena maculata TaxID=230809 RepID=A0AAD7KG39_9AGAR|nr:cytochrome P450 [Mycena maculata]
MSSPTHPYFSQTTLATALISATAVGVMSASYLYFNRPALKSRDKEIHELGGVPLLNAWAFFTRRYDFLRETFQRTGETLFRFRVLQHRVVASSGVEARTVFFNDKTLSLDEGYKVLLGGGPKLEEIHIDTGGLDKEAHFIRQLRTLTTPERLQDVFPSLLSDIDRHIGAWGAEGSIDPFTEIYKLVFQLTVRMATCRELADDRAAVARLCGLYDALEAGTTPAAVLLPWFPSPARAAREAATAGMYTMLHAYVERRRAAPVPSRDPIDVLLASGAPTEGIIGFVLGTIFAGVLNTGVNACWALLHLGLAPAWKARATAEIHALLATYAPAAGPLHARLAAIPVRAWEAETPATDAALRETLRLVMGGVALRRNVGARAVAVGERGAVGRGEFLVYPLADVHLDPAVYAAPARFDPGRYDAGRAEDTRVPLAYVAWGAGRHPCTGMRLAKLEMKAVLAFVLAGCEYAVVDGAGRALDALPAIDRNDLHLAGKARPMEPCRIQFKRVGDSE